MQLFHIFTVLDNPHDSRDSYGEDYFVDGAFRRVHSVSPLHTSHVVVTPGGNVFKNTKNIPFGKSLTLLGYPETISENKLDYLMGLLTVSAENHNIKEILKIPFPYYSETPTLPQLRLCYAVKELQKLVGEIHALRNDFYSLYHSVPATETLDRYTHLDNIRFTEAISEGDVGDDKHFGQSGLIRVTDARSGMLMEVLRLPVVSEKLYLTLLSSIRSSLSRTTPVHDQAGIDYIINKLTAKHLIRNISLQRQVERYLRNQIKNLVTGLNDAKPDTEKKDTTN